MNKEKINKISYWVVTVLVSANYLFAGIIYFGQGQNVQDGAKALGYPLYFFIILGVWKILGAIALVLPGTPRLKEWAYAGMVINLTSAAISNGVSGLETTHIVTPMIMLVLVILSWSLRPDSRKLPGEIL